MGKIIFWSLLLLGVIVFWREYGAKEFVWPHFGSDKVVIEFTDGEDLLNQLRKVETGREVEIHQKGDGMKYVDTGISCNDEAGKAAYREKADRELAELNKAIAAELKRIQKIP